MSRLGSGSSERSDLRFPNRPLGREGEILTSVTLRRVQIILVLFLFWVLAMVLPDVHFAPGNRTALQEGLRGVHPSPELVLGVFSAVTLIALAGVLLWAFLNVLRRKKKHDDEHQMYREPIPTPWPIYVIVLFILAAAGGLVWWTWEPSTTVERTGGPDYWHAPEGDREKESLSAAPPSALPMREHRSPEWVVIPLAFSFAIGLGVVLWRWLRRQSGRETSEVPEVGQAVAQAVWELESGGELSDIVLGCYREMCRILGQKAALRREMTAREFVRHLDQVGVRGEEIASLTTLFERVRYGRLATGPEERAEAIALLKAIETRYGKGHQASLQGWEEK